MLLWVPACLVPLDYGGREDAQFLPGHPVRFSSLSNAAFLRIELSGMLTPAYPEYSSSLGYVPLS